MIPIKLLSDQTFKQYGEIIRYDERNSVCFQVVLNESEGAGWRIAVKKTAEHELLLLARHPDSRESFEPLQGVALIAVALPDTPEAIEVFLLDQPICLYKNIWHNTLCLSESSFQKIIENDQVSSEKYRLPQELRVAVI